MTTLDAHHPATFPDGGLFRIEIPSVEGPAALEAVIDQAQRYGLTIHRVSQGSGVAMLDDAEIRAMVGAADAADMELCLFLGPRGTWDIGAGAKMPGSGLGPRVRGADQLRYSVDDAMRAVDLGVRCLLVADEGVLHELHLARIRGDLPGDVRLKMSALTGPAMREPQEQLTSTHETTTQRRQARANSQDSRDPTNRALNNMQC